jgi:hypothetical protein
MPEILGFVLPHPLDELVASGVWSSPDWKREFLARAGLREKLADIWFVPPNRMEGWMADLRSFRAEVGAVPFERTFKMQASKELGTQVHLPLADIDQGLPLADSHGEPWLWLDYRDRDEPRVLELAPRPREWVELADSFHTLVSRIRT